MFAALSAPSDAMDTLRHNGEIAANASQSVQSVVSRPEPATASHLPIAERTDVAASDSGTKSGAFGHLSL
jgi:hypothetical protein